MEDRGWTALFVEEVVYSDVVVLDLNASDLLPIIVQLLIFCRLEVSRCVI